MNSDKIGKLEKSIKLKKKIFSKGIWKNYAIVPPAIVMFVGIFGIIYLLNIDKLISWHAIPFIIIFALGTIWLKSARRFLVNRKITDNKEFLVCLAIPVEKINKKTILLFSSGKNRNNRYYLEKEKKDILEDGNIDLSTIGKRGTQIEDTDIYLVQLPISEKFSTKSLNEYWLVYTGKDSVDFITLQEVSKYS